MKNLRDALLKAGAVSDKQKRQFEHAKRQEDKARLKQPRSAPDAAGAPSPHAAQGTQPDQADRPLPSGGPAESAEEIRLRTLIALIHDGQLDQEIGGRRRFYFVARDGSIPFMPVSESLGLKLERGHAAIVENPAKTGDHTVITREAAVKLQSAAGDLLRFFRA